MVRGTSLVLTSWGKARRRGRTEQGQGQVGALGALAQGLSHCGLAVVLR